MYVAATPYVHRGIHAKRISPVLWSELARQTRNGGPFLTGKTVVTNKPLSIDDVAAVARVAAVAPSAAPEDVAVFRAVLAKISRSWSLVASQKSCSTRIPVSKVRAPFCTRVPTASTSSAGGRL